MNNHNVSDSILEEKVKTKLLSETVERASLLSWMLAFVFGAFGFTSIEFIQKYSPDISLWQNVWPRLLVGTLPFSMLALFCKNKSITHSKKIYIWTFGFATIFHASAWIHVWPITLSKNPEILTYVHGANLFLFSILYSAIAPPKQIILPFTAIFVSLFVVPLFVVAHIAGDTIIFKTILNDSLLAISCSYALSLVISKLRYKLSKSEIESEIEASRFLGPVLSQAVFEKKTKVLERIRCKAFIVSIDIRNSTDLQNSKGESWLRFRHEYFSAIGQLATRYGGYIQKTIGDCHVVNFGVMDYGVDLSDIPGIETQLARADENRLKRASKASLSFVEELFDEFNQLAQSFFPGDMICLGAGIDKGWVERGLQGDESQTLEIDVNGDPVNCSNRLQEYSKQIRDALNWNSSILVVSPFATDYFENLDKFVKYNTQTNPIRNYSGIRWVFALKHQSISFGNLKKAA